MTKYQKQLLRLLPILNLLCGITIDLYAPSLPQIQHFYSISQAAAKNTITITILGFACGQLIFGFLSDHYGRRTTLKFSLLMYILSSLGIIFFKNAYILFLGRFLQGVACGSFAVNSRAIAVDNFKSHDLKIAIIYLSLACGIGPIIAPYIGGFLATYLPWQVAFYLMLIYATVLFWCVNSLISRQSHAQSTLKDYFVATVEMLSNKNFLSRTSILGLCYTQGIIFNLVAPFWVVYLFHKPPATFGQAALMLGCGYFCGTFLNRFLVRKVQEARLIGCGLTIGIVFSLILVFKSEFTSIYEVAGLLGLINFGAGFVFSNVIASNISQFAKFAGICTALQGSLMLSIGASLSYLVSTIHEPSIKVISVLFLCLLLLQVILQAVNKRSMTKKHVLARQLSIQQ
jgi:MFS transporter, DHA1 family, multidrug resistance protein